LNNAFLGAGLLLSAQFLYSGHWNKDASESGVIRGALCLVFIISVDVWTYAYSNIERTSNWPITACSQTPSVLSFTNHSTSPSYIFWGNK